MAASEPVSPATLAELRRLAAAEPQMGFVTTRRDGTSQASMVRAGLFDDPMTGRQAMAVLVRGYALKLRNLRRTPRATLFLRAANDWATAEGPVTIIGPDDPHPDFDAQRFAALRREVATAIGRKDKSWEEFDALMDRERRAVVFVALERAYSIR
jgi:hypothetical protein